MKKAMFTVEVLISIFILFLVVTLSATSSKFLNQILRQQDRYKELYTVVFSIKDKISNEICRQENTVRGEFSNLEYVAECTLIQEAREFEKDYDFDNGAEIKGNTGLYMFTLYQVNLEVVKHNYTATYLLTRYQEKSKQ
jgi:hypothetical protein